MNITEKQKDLAISNIRARLEVGREVMIGNRLFDAETVDQLLVEFFFRGVNRRESSVAESIIEELLLTSNIEEY